MRALIARYTLLVVLLAILALIIEGDLFIVSPIVIAGQVAAIVLLVTARTAFRKQKFNFTADPGEGPVVRRGPYRLLRHPMYSGALLFVWTSILGHWSILNGAIGAVVLVFALLRISVEEQLLREHYPDYAEYALRTKRIVPFIY